LVGVAKLLLTLPPLPPFAIIISKPSSSRSAIIFPVSASLTIQPTGTFIKISFPFFPSFKDEPPGAPLSAL
jgi:hypothetical protein